MFFSATAAVSVAALGLAACDESSSSDINLPARFDSLEDFATAVESGELQLADPAAMTATAQSSGGVEVRNKNGTCDQAAFGVMTQLADFDHVTVTDSVTNNELYDVDANDNCHLNMPLVVTLAVEGTISGTELTADMTGILNHGADFHVDTTMDGTFHDYGGKLSAFGDIEGDYDDQEVSGGFAVIRGLPPVNHDPEDAAPRGAASACQNHPD